jgi:hypothetical protein
VVGLVAEGVGVEQLVVIVLPPLLMGPIEEVALVHVVVPAESLEVLR